MPLPVDTPGKRDKRRPGRKICRIRHVEVPFRVEDVLVHHDILREFSAGERILHKAVGSVRDSGKTVEFCSARNLVATILQFGRLGGDCHRPRKDARKRKRCAKKKSLDPGHLCNS